MLEILTYRAYKKHKLSKQLREKNAKEALDPQDEDFLRSSLHTDTATPSSKKAPSKKFPLTLRPPKKNEKPTTPAEESSDGMTTPAPTEEELEVINASKDGTQAPLS